jgi:hypothetical protein
LRSTRSIAARATADLGAQEAPRRALAEDFALLVAADVFWADVTEAARDARRRAEMPDCGRGDPGLGPS